MEKELFVKAILAIKEQMEYDVKIAKKLAEAFPDVFYPNLLYNNSILSDSLLDILQELMEDDENWISYFCFDLDFGAESYRLKACDKENKEIPQSTPEELWEWLNKLKNK